MWQHLKLSDSNQLDANVHLYHDEFVETPHLVLTSPNFTEEKTQYEHNVPLTKISISKIFSTVSRNQRSPGLNCKTFFCKGVAGAWIRCQSVHVTWLLNGWRFFGERPCLDCRWCISMNLSLAYNCCMHGLLKLWSWFACVWRSPKTSIATETQNYVLSWVSSWFQISIGLALQHHSWLWRCWAQKFKRDWAGATWSELSLGEVGRTSLKCSTPAPDVDNDQLVWCWWWVFEMIFVHSLKFAWLCWLSAPRTHSQYVFSWCL